jgi:hypothetical protein
MNERGKELLNMKMGARFLVDVTDICHRNRYNIDEIIREEEGDSGQILIIELAEDKAIELAKYLHSFISNADVIEEWNTTPGGNSMAVLQKEDVVFNVQLRLNYIYMHFRN